MSHHWPGSDVQGMTHNLLGSVSKTGNLQADVWCRLLQLLVLMQLSLPTLRCSADNTCRPSTDTSWETSTGGRPMHLPPDLPVAGPAAVIQWLQAKRSFTFTGQQQTVAGLRTAEERRKAAALAFLGKEAMALETHPVTLSFREPSKCWLPLGMAIQQGHPQALPEVTLQTARSGCSIWQTHVINRRLPC